MKILVRKLSKSLLQGIQRQQGQMLKDMISLKEQRRNMLNSTRALPRMGLSPWALGWGGRGIGELGVFTQVLTKQARGCIGNSLIFISADATA